MARSLFRLPGQAGQRRALSCRKTMIKADSVKADRSIDDSDCPDEPAMTVAALLGGHEHPVQAKGQRDIQLGLEDRTIGQVQAFVDRNAGARSLPVQSGSDDPEIVPSSGFRNDQMFFQHLAILEV